jgi:hypothetical protein
LGLVDLGAEDAHELATPVVGPRHRRAGRKSTQPEQTSPLTLIRRESWVKLRRN